MRLKEPLIELPFMKADSIPLIAATQLTSKANQKRIKLVRETKLVPLTQEKILETEKVNRKSLKRQEKLEMEKS